MVTADIVLTVYNGARFLPEQIESIQRQTHDAWRLWIRDDGSTDDTPALLRDIGASDGRIEVHDADGEQRGVSEGFSWLLDRLPDDAGYVFCADADDVWLPEKIERSLAAMLAEEAEAGAGEPILVHTDLTMTDAALKPLGASLWQQLGIGPEPPTLRELVVRNVVTGPTILMNRPLVDRVVPIPGEVPHHDWWIALVATAMGRTVALPDPMVLYRRHPDNHTGEYAVGKATLGRAVRHALGTWSRTPGLRWWLGATARQAGLFLDRFHDELSPENRAFLRAYAEIPTLPFLRRKLRALRLRAVPGQSLASKMALALRA